MEQGIYNAYTIFDWTINDVWTANGKMGWAYNSLYDLYYQAGVPLTRQRVASPFISEAIPMPHIYRAIDPDTWGKMISRVNGVNFAGMYGTSTAMGWRSIKCPKGFSWERYMEFLLSTLPTHIRHNYEEKLRVSKKLWRERGGCLAPVTKERELKKAIQEKYKSPVYNVIAVPIEKVKSNDYNPNIVAPPEMKLLELSIWEDGYTMPCVCYYDSATDTYELVDGYHRYMVMRTSKRVREREQGLLPVTVIDKDISNRMASTIRHNRARGTHSVELMSNIVAELCRSDMSDAWIMKNIGMDRDELLRLKQITGLADLFANSEFSMSDEWEDE